MDKTQVLSFWLEFLKVVLRLFEETSENRQTFVCDFGYAGRIRHYNFNKMYLSAEKKIHSD